MDKGSQYALWTFFIVHVVFYSVANIFLLFVNLIMYAKELWFHVPLLVWSLIVLIHYFLTKLTIAGYFSDLRNKIIEKLNQ